MKSTLIDAGPIIALFYRTDKYPGSIVAFLKGNPCHLITTCPVVTEACHMLDFDSNAPLALLEWIDRGGLELFNVTRNEIPRIVKLIRKYKDLPMDLADATLVVTAEILGVREIITIDRDFYVYRTISKELIVNIFDE